MLGMLPGAQRNADFFTRLKNSTDVAWLERLASDPEAAYSETPSLYGPKVTRGMAYARLGAVGTPEAIAAVRRIERSARSWTPMSASVSLDRLPHPAAHFSDYHPRPFAQVMAPDGVTYGLITLSLLGGSDVFVTASATPGRASDWSRPRLVANRAPFGIRDPLLSWTDGHLRLEFSAVTDPKALAVLRPYGPFGRPPGTPPADRQVWDISLFETTRDTDGDGWTDIEEKRLGARLDSADSDGDGIDDGADVCPMFAPSPAEASDAEAEILKKVFFAGFGLHRARDVLLVKGDSRPLQLWGSLGPVLYGVDRSDWGSRWGLAPPILSWKLTVLATDSATVVFSDFEGALAAAGYTATLKHIDGEWFVVALVMDWIS